MKWLISPFLENNHSDLHLLVHTLEHFQLVLVAEAVSDKPPD